MGFGGEIVGAGGWMMSSVCLMLFLVVVVESEKGLVV